MAELFGLLTLIFGGITACLSLFSFYQIWRDRMTYKLADILVINAILFVVCYAAFMFMSKGS